MIGYSQPWVSNMLRGRQELTVEQVRVIATRLGVPVHLLRFGDPGSDDPTKRRDFGKTVALALLPLPAHTEVDDATASNLSTITGAQRRMDATTPARELARGATAHVEMANRILARSHRSPYTADVAAAASEAAGFAAWLHADMHDIGTAQSYYRMAIERARHTGNNLLTGYMLGSLAAFEMDGEDPALGLTMIGEARRQIGDRPHPTAHAWLKSIEALGHAAANRDRGAAERALKQAERAVGKADSASAPPWPWVFPFDHAKLAGYRALVAVRLARPNEALAAFADSLPAIHPAPKQRAVLMLEVATAMRQAGQADRDTNQTDEAFRLANEALTTGITYASERIVRRARRFRRDYMGPGTGPVRAFEDRLRTTLS